VRTLAWLGTVIAFGITSPLFAQNSVTDSARCAAALSAPTPESVTVELHALVSPLDKARKLPDSYGELIAAGLRQMLVLPRPLAINTYDPRAGIARGETSSKQYAAATLRSFYLLTLHGDGHVSNVRVLGGLRNGAFDRAIIAALVALDTSRMLPPPSGFDAAFDHDTLALRLTITPGFMSASAPAVAPQQAGVTPLFRFRVPIYPIVHDDSRALPDNPYPRYPADMRARGIEGEVMLEFLVLPDGTVDPESMIALRATSPEFLAAVVAVAPRMRFYPVKIAGCAVTMLVQMPFVFALNR
jgi:TonB family protein